MAQEQENRGGAWKALRQKWSGRSPERGEAGGDEAPRAKARRLSRPERTRVLTTSNQKGGVGKTTTTVNLAAALARAGMRVLVIDIDPQGNASTALNIPHTGEVPSVYDVLLGEMEIQDVLQDAPDIDGLQVVPATIELARAESELPRIDAQEKRDDDDDHAADATTDGNSTSASAPSSGYAAGVKSPALPESHRPPSPPPARRMFPVAPAAPVYGHTLLPVRLRWPPRRG